MRPRTRAGCWVRAFSSARRIARESRITGRRSTRSRAVTSVRTTRASRRRRRCSTPWLTTSTTPFRCRSRRRRPTRRPSRAASSSSTTRRRPRAPAATPVQTRTDSGQGNPTLDLSGPILLHDVGTCVTSGPWPDVAHDDVTGAPRAACAFDTPALRGLSDSAPYLHDGSAPTLDDVIPIMLLATAPSCTTPRTALSPADRGALVEYLRSL